jgi:hypothetical protein
MVDHTNTSTIPCAYNASQPPPQSNHELCAILDSGTTGNYLTINSPVSNIIPTPNGVRAAIPDGKILQASHQCELWLPKLPPNARVGHIFQEFKNPLISVALLCNNGCEVNFTQAQVTVKLNAQTILEGYRELPTGLWRVKLEENITSTDNTTKHVNSVMPAGTIADTINFLYKACFSPSTSTFIKAIENGHFSTWPMLTSENVKKYLPKSEATAMGILTNTGKIPNQQNPIKLEQQPQQSTTIRPTIQPLQRGHIKSTLTSWTSTNQQDKFYWIRQANFRYNRVEETNTS